MAPPAELSQVDADPALEANQGVLFLHALDERARLLGNPQQRFKQHQGMHTAIGLDIKLGEAR